MSVRVTEAGLTGSVLSRILTACSCTQSPAVFALLWDESGFHNLDAPDQIPAGSASSFISSSGEVCTFSTTIYRGI